MSDILPTYRQLEKLYGTGKKKRTKKTCSPVPNFRIGVDCNQPVKVAFGNDNKVNEAKEQIKFHITDEKKEATNINCNHANNISVATNSLAKTKDEIKDHITAGENEESKFSFDYENRKSGKEDIFSINQYKPLEQNSTVKTCFTWKPIPSLPAGMLALLLPHRF